MNEQKTKTIWVATFKYGAGNITEFTAKETAKLYTLSNRKEVYGWPEYGSRISKDATSIALSLNEAIDKVIAGASRAAESAKEAWEKAEQVAIKTKKEMEQLRAVTSDHAN